MLFSGLPFFVFFAGYFILHLATPPKHRVFLIIAGSTVFYSWWKVEYVWIPFVLTFIAWLGVSWIGRTKEHPARRRRLILTVVAVFTPLFVVKYAYFLGHDVVGLLLPGAGAVLDDLSDLRFALPLGISFVTFTLTAYVVDTYSGRFRAEPRLSTLLGYVLFFPHLIAGPILRPHELIPQLTQPRSARGARFALGIVVFTLGLVKKLIFADTLAQVVDPVFKPDADSSAWETLLAVYGFSAQIYCDFSGYTDMAIGLAYMLRIRLPTNFARPYTSASVIEFWHRWHITLSRWLRDYLYIALGGNRMGRPRQIANIMVTMALGGLWHGANWTFVVWGCLHGIALAASHLLKSVLLRARITLPSWLAVLLTFHFVTVAWIYFRAPDLVVAQRVLTAPFSAPWADFGGFARANLFPLTLLAVFFLTHRFDRHARLRLLLRRANMAMVWAVVVCLWVLAIAMRQGSSAKFIYFDF
jgi:alginate O-acetyltransferase complex protein AlgI